MVKLVAVYSQPKDPAAFDKYYFGTHTPLAKKMPGLVKLEIEKVTGSPIPGAETPYLAAHMYFESADARDASLKSPEGKATAKDLRNFADPGPRMYLTEVVK